MSEDSPKINDVLGNQKLMLVALERIADMEAHEQTRQQRDVIIEQQKLMNKSMDNLVVHIDRARIELDKAVKELTGSIMGIVQVPIAVTIIGVASWAFFMKYIDQYVWLILMGVAAFRYLSDSITGVAKLIGLKRNGEIK